MNTSKKLLVDTNILSLYFKKYPKVVAEAQNYLQQHKIFTFSIIARFEILRGMKVKNASAQLRFFDLFCSQNEIIELDDNIIIKASDIYADLYKKGQIIGDADILIAATALENSLSLVTNNESHFNRIPGLHIVNWNR